MDLHTPEHDGARPVVDEPPPFLGTWSRVYAFVLSYLAVVIVLMYIFTLAYTR